MKQANAADQDLFKLRVCFLMHLSVYNVWKDAAGQF